MKRMSYIQPVISIFETMPETTLLANTGQFVTDGNNVNVTPDSSEGDFGDDNTINAKGDTWEAWD